MVWHCSNSVAVYKCPDKLIYLLINLEQSQLAIRHIHATVNSFSTWLLSSCTDEYAHT